MDLIAYLVMLLIYFVMLFISLRSTSIGIYLGAINLVFILFIFALSPNGITSTFYFINSQNQIVSQDAVIITSQELALITIILTVVQSLILIHKLRV